MDSYYLNNALELMNEFLKTAENPRFGGEIVFERRAPHCWGPRGRELHEKMAAFVAQRRPR
jgi:hypothetical protein